MKLTKNRYINVPCVLFLVCFLCSLHSYEYPKRIPGYYSQHGQDKFLAEGIFKEKNEGVFIEIGAHDGVSFSNTYYFEKHRGWKGICVEPIPELYKKLVNNRSCICENYCIDVVEGRKTFLRCYGYINEMYSGIFNYYDPRHLDRIELEMREYGGSKTLIEVKCSTFHKILEKHNINYVDLLSLDIEGGEETILRSIDFNRVEIAVILVENNFGEDPIINFLKSKDYELIKKIGKDNVFIKKELL